MRNVDEEWKWASAEVSPLQPSHSLPPTSATDEDRKTNFKIFLPQISQCTLTSSSP